MSDSDSDSAAMAAAMGFSSFGGKPATKKRKFNATTDAFVEGEELEKIDRGGKKGGGSGGNQVPLGKMRVFGTGGRKDDGTDGYNGREGTEMEMGVLGGDVRGGEMEREREMSTGESESEGPQYIDTSRTPPADEDDGPRYIDTSEPAPVARSTQTQHELSYPPTNEHAPIVAEEENPVSEAEAMEMQRRIDSLLQSIGSAPPLPSNAVGVDDLPYGSSSSKASNVRSHQIPAPSSLPNRPAGGVFSSSRGGGGNSGKGAKNEKWWVDYYDPAFNRNPWEELEKERGLGSVGTWLEMPKGQGRGGQRA
ncbi:hypothetical protein VTL71DRAFT_14642 [Oculimacula yallundae]|uniref:Uncharacterized protein n=1 Tax=Oculimacula yallundae TaxID=86028 RepID=A0ABR4CKD6_9HELO